MSKSEFNMEIEDFVKFPESDIDPDAPQISLELTVRPELYLDAPFTIWSTVRYEPSEQGTEDHPVTVQWDLAEANRNLILLRQTENGFEKVETKQGGSKQEGINQDKAKQEGPKQEGPKQDDLKLNGHEGILGEIKQNGMDQEEVKQNAIKQENPKENQINGEKAATDGVNINGVKHDELMPDQPSRNETKQDELTQDQVMQNTIKPAEINEDQLMPTQPKDNEVKQPAAAQEVELDETKDAETKHDQLMPDNFTPDGFTEEPEQIDTPPQQPTLKISLSNPDLTSLTLSFPTPPSSNPTSSITTQAIPPSVPVEILCSLPSTYNPYLTVGQTYVLVFPGCSVSLLGQVEEGKDGEVQENGRKEVVIPGTWTTEFEVWEKEIAPVVEEEELFVPTRLGRANTVPSFRMSFHE